MMVDIWQSLSLMDTDHGAHGARHAGIRRGGLEVFHARGVADHEREVAAGGSTRDGDPGGINRIPRGVGAQETLAHGAGKAAHRTGGKMIGAALEPAVRGGEQK